MIDGKKREGKKKVREEKKRAKKGHYRPQTRRDGADALFASISASTWIRVNSVTKKKGKKREWEDWKIPGPGKDFENFSLLLTHCVPFFVCPSHLNAVLFLASDESFG